MNFEQQLQVWRHRAGEDARYFEAHYPQGEYGLEFSSIARRWCTALSRDELDPNELRQVLTDAERHETGSGISYWGFVGWMRSVYHELWEYYLQDNDDTSSRDRL